MMRTFSLLLPLAALLLASPALAQGRRFEVTVTNITKTQTFTPILVTTHDPDVALFQAGQPASPELEALAESGARAPFLALLAGLGDQVSSAAEIPGLLGPGESRSIEIDADKRHVLSVAAMLIPTNDNFFAVNGQRLPSFRPATFNAPAYDAGTEENDQNCANIPGPQCATDAGQGEGESAPADGDEGHVFIGNGMHDLGVEDEAGNRILDPFVYDWRNPVARVTVRRVRAR